ncbi:MAG: hypothetical protein EXS14_07090 [Planctomycetes bacterium]|nr:hypothetical protein [Planctomycetota bacterium]
MWRRVLPPLLILAAALTLQVPRLNAPFGPAEINAGVFFGPFAQAWEHFGFAEARGVPFACSPYANPQEAMVYLNHPPGAFWIYAACGTSEWQLRLPGLIATIASALLLYALLKPHVQAVAACGAGLLLVLTPVLAVYAQVSYEPLVLAAGLLLFYAFEQAFRMTEQWQRRLAKLCLLLVAFFCVWLDWAALFFVLSLFALVPGKRRADALRLAGLGCGMAIASIAAVCVWQLWAVHAPLFGGGKTGGDLGNIVQTALLNRPALSGFISNCVARIGEGFGGLLPFLLLPFGLLMLPGPVWRLLAALAIPALLNPLIFARHAEGHVFFFAYLAPVLAATWSGLLLLRARFPLATCILSALVVLPVGSMTIAGISATTHPFFRDLGHELDRLTVQQSADGAPPVTHRIHTNLPYAYPYYYKSPGVTFASTLAQLEAARATHDPRCGLRFLWCYLDARGPDAARVFAADPNLLAQLMAHGSTSVPILEGAIPDPQQRLSVRVVRARIFQVIEPKR